MNKNAWIITNISLQNALVLYCLVNPTNDVLDHVSFYVLITYQDRCQDLYKLKEITYFIFILVSVGI